MEKHWTGTPERGGFPRSATKLGRIQELSQNLSLYIYRMKAGEQKY